MGSFIIRDFLRVDKNGAHEEKSLFAPDQLLHDESFLQVKITVENLGRAGMNKKIGSKKYTV